jgi:hypothetical protein
MSMKLVSYTRRKWEHNVGTDIRKIVREVVCWIHLARDKDQWPAYVNMVMNLWVPQEA